MTAACLLVLAGAVAIHVEQTRNVEPATVGAILDVVSKMVTDRTGEPPAMDNLAWGVACQREVGCLSEVRLRTRAQVVLTLSFVGGPTRIRVIAERFDASNARAEHTTDLSRRASSWSTPLGGLVEALVSRRKTAELRVAPVVAPPPPNQWPWIVFGAGATALAVGVGFGISGQAATDTLASGPNKGEAYLDLRGRASTHATLANVFVTAGVATLVAGAVMLVVDGSI